MACATEGCTAIHCLRSRAEAENKKRKTLTAPPPSFDQLNRNGNLRRHGGLIRGGEDTTRMQRRLLQHE